jgi:hypothetical protein
MYSSAYVEWPSKDFFALIYGFNPGANIYIPRPDESLIEGHGFFRFAELGLGPVEEDDSVGIDFAWDITGERRDGVYRQITTMADYDGDWRNIPYIWYCETFIEWFERLVIGPAELLK